MKLRKTHGLSAKVLQRKSAKKEKTINALIVVVYCLAIICVLLWGQYNKKYEALAKKANAWLFHQRRNDHHWQFWVLRNDNGTTQALPMPDAARKEMLADWMGAGRAVELP